MAGIEARLRRLEERAREREGTDGGPPINTEGPWTPEEMLGLIRLMNRRDLPKKTEDDLRKVGESITRNWHRYHPDAAPLETEEEMLTRYARVLGRERVLALATAKSRDATEYMLRVLDADGR